MDFYLVVITIGAYLDGLRQNLSTIWPELIMQRLAISESSPWRYIDELASATYCEFANQM